MKPTTKIETLGFGGGCHWCTEAVFQSLRGVITVKQGFIRSIAPHDALSEAVLVRFNSELISTSDLVEIHLRTHSSGSNHSFRGKYRSAIYYQREPSKAEQKPLQLKEILAELDSDFDRKRITLVLPIAAFEISDQRYQDYYLKNSQKPFCKTYIDPKLKMLREKYSEHLL